MKNLNQLTADLNVRMAKFNDENGLAIWNTLRLERGYKVGRNGTSYRGTTGDKVHLLITEKLISRTDAQKPGQLRIGDYFSIGGVCGSNGQRTGVVFEGLDTDKVTCTKCLKYLANLSA